MITLTMSEAPSNSRATSDRVRLRESPKIIVHTPNPATQNNMVSPARRRRGRCATRIAIAIAPTPGALRSRPSPQGPVLRISLAYTGSSATAPPSRTANMSSEIEPSTSLWFQM